MFQEGKQTDLYSSYHNNMLIYECIPTSMASTSIRMDLLQIN
jgi:hypothetical protein